MQLTDEEKRMLGGQKGKTVQYAMECLLQLGEAFDAEKMVEISYAHVHSGMALYKGDVERVESLADGQTKVRVPSSTQIGSVDIENWKAMGAPEALVRHQKRAIEAHKKLEITSTFTCAPYLMGYLPPKGSHISSVETSAIIFFNSVLGAKTNRDGFFSLFAAITGRYPLCGYHIDENRVGTHLFNVETDLKHTGDYFALGFHAGKLVQDGVPVFNGIKNPSFEQLKSLGAALATSGSAALYHIPGITAEARTVDDAFRSTVPKDEFYVGSEEIDLSYKFLTDVKQGDEIDFVHLGCPHYSIEEIRDVAEMLKGKKIDPNVTLWVCTTRAAKPMADRMGYTGIIEKAGGLVLCDTCPISTYLCQTSALPEGITIPKDAVQTMVSDSAKQTKYGREMIGCKVALGSVKSCIESALTGEWRVKND